MPGPGPVYRDRSVLGIFGGTFDPVHFGHIKLTLALLEHFDFEQIRFIPCQQPPHKQAVCVDAAHRWQMLNLVTHSSPKLVVDDRELKRSGPSYMIDTLKEFREETRAACALVLILGVDAFLNFCTWHKYDEILSICHIMLLRRPGYRLAGQGCEYGLYREHGTDEIMAVCQASGGYIYLSDEEEIEISSTAIRQCIAEGRQPRYLLPGNVWDYIRRHDLYR